MNLLSFFAVGLGAFAGAVLRWVLSLALNPVLPQLPLGTLAANLVGGFLVGLAVAMFADRADLAPAWRLFIITGCLGGLTTFSTFSAESVAMIARGDYGWALGHAGAHLIGSLALTALGIATYRALA